MKILSIIGVAAMTCGLLLSHGAHADSDEMPMMGAGTSSCSRYLDVVSSNAAADRVFFSWAQGFMTGLNLTRNRSNEMADLSDHESQKDWLKNYCEANQRKPYYSGVLALLSELRRDQGLNE